MKLIYAVNARIPTEKAHGLQIMKTCEALAAQGIVLELIVPARQTRLLEKDPFVFYGVSRNFKITRLWTLDLILGRLTFWLQTWTFWLSIKKYLKSSQLDASYTRDLFLALKLPQPVFYEIHTLPERPSFYHCRAWQRAKKLIVISQGLKETLIKWNVPEEKIMVVRDAVDVEKFQIKETKEECRQKLNLPLDKKIVVYTGHLYEWKGAHVLAEAAGVVSKTKGNNLQVDIVGGTPEDVANFRKKHKHFNLNIFGWEEHDLIPYWLKAADLLVLPMSSKEKIGAQYTSPLKLFEYMASGTPIIAADLPSLREILTEKEAVFFQADNIDSLAETINDSLENRQELEKKAAAARLKVLDFTWGKRAKKIIEIISA